MRKITLFAALAAVLFAVSCESLEDMAMTGTPDQKAIAKGVTAWNDKEPSAAKPFWNTIKEKALRDKYAGYVDTFASGDKLLSDAASAGAGDEAKSLAAYEKAQKTLTGIPKELALPQDTLASGRTMAEVRMRSLIAADRLAYARELGKNAVATFGESDAIESMDAEIEVILASRKREASADAFLQKAREDSADFDGRIKGLDAAAAAYARAEAALAEDAGRAKTAKAQSVSREAVRLRKKRQDLTVEREKLLREQAYAYKDRIGEEFARVPEGDKVGNMSLEEILAYQESVKKNVEEAYREMVAFSERYPQVADPEFMEEVDAQKKDLDAKIAQVNQEIRTAREIASRGKVVMPIMIGLFNPQPGSAAEAKKSRPAVFQSKGVKGKEYWWGMVSIPKGTLNDLVITVKDSRTVRVFPENTKSGTLVDKNKIKDLVNRGYKVGNSWPVLNAGSQLPTDKYFFEIQEGKTPDYEGEVVVYSSFIVRMR